MKSLQLLIILFFVGFVFSQQAQITRFYGEMNAMRTKYCLPAMRVATDLERAAQGAANAMCNNQQFMTPEGTSAFTGSFQSKKKATYEDAFKSAKSLYQGSLRVWNCGSDTGSGNSEFVRLSVVPGQEVGCAFSPLVCGRRNMYNVFCIFRTPAPPQGSHVVPVSKCTSCGGTSGTPTTTTGGTPTTTGGTPTTTGSTTGGSTGNIVRDGHLNAINAARSCVGVPPVTWDETLASHAQAYANQLASICSGLEHANQQEEGENLWMVGGGSLQSAIATGNNLWNGEARDYDCYSNTCPDDKQCGHYTQNVWANTKRVGCGVAKCSAGYYGVCRYGPPGNYIGEHPFGTAKCSAFEQCKRGGVAVGRALSNTSPSTAQNPSTRFFESDSQIVVFALAIFIVVVVVAILVLVVIITKRRGANRDLEYQLLETK